MPSSETAKARYARYRARNAEKLRERRAAYYANNKERCCQWVRECREANPAIRRNEAAKKREKRRTPLGNLQNRVQRGVRRGLARGTPSMSTERAIGYTFVELREHLERQFLRGMSWENMGEWHIDHIVPLASFSIAEPEDPEFKRAWALTNLRPMWASANMSKGAKRTHLL